MYVYRALVLGERASEVIAAPLEVTLSSLERKTIFYTGLISYIVIMHTKRLQRY